MARGRFISKEICTDKKVNELSSPWSMLAFTWLICHADCEGRVYGDPSIVKSMVFPRQDGGITTDQVRGFIEEWQSVGLVNWYEVDGDKYIEFPNFDKHQHGLRKDREPKSTIPANIRQSSGNLPAKCRLNKNENDNDNVNQNDNTEAQPEIETDPIQRLFEVELGFMPSISDIKALDEFKSMGATIEDLREGIKWRLANNSAPIRNYAAVIQPTKTAMLKRTQRKFTSGKTRKVTNQDGEVREVPA